jgi:hypothetical protein
MAAPADTGFATGLLLVVVGTWIAARTFIRDAGGKNLVDRLVDYGGGKGDTPKYDDTGDLLEDALNPLNSFGVGGPLANGPLAPLGPAGQRVTRPSDVLGGAGVGVGIVGPRIGPFGVPETATPRPGPRRRRRANP